MQDRPHSQENPETEVYYTILVEKSHVHTREKQQSLLTIADVLFHMKQHRSIYNINATHD